MRRQHYKAYDQRGTRVQSPIVTPGAQLRLERYSASSAGVTWSDISANGNNATATDAAIFADFNFDGVTDSVQVTSADPSADQSQDFSFAFWYRRTLDAVQQSTIADSRAPLPAGSDGGWTFRDNAANATPPPYNHSDYFLSVYTVFGNYNISNMAPGTDSNWHYAVVVWENGFGWRFYADGEQYIAPSPTATVANVDGSPMRIGRGAYNHYSGYIDTVRVWQRILSPDEILRDYHAGAPSHQSLIVTEDLVSQYVPQGMTTTSWADVTGSNNMTGAVTAPPAFDGDDYYTIGNPADLQFTNNWSIEAWASQSDAAPAGAFERLISRDDIAASRCFILSQRDSDGFPFAGIFVGGTLKSVTGSSDYADGNYHHYMVTHDGATLKLYVDGALEGSVATGGPMDNDPVNWEIGRAQNDSGYLNTGRVDTVRFYDATLSEAQVKQNYYAGKAAHT